MKQISLTDYGWHAVPSAFAAINRRVAEVVTSDARAYVAFEDKGLLIFHLAGGWDDCTPYIEIANTSYIDFEDALTLGVIDREEGARLKRVDADEQARVKDVQERREYERLRAKFDQDAREEMVRRSSTKP